MQSNLVKKPCHQSLRTLEGQVKQSRIALQNLSLCLGSMSSQKITSLEQDLRAVIRRLNEQTVRKRLLEQIIQVMSQKDQINGCVIDKSEIERQLVKQKQKQKELQDFKKSIDQIVCKNNEEINKITKLKQQVNNLRTERVMYSNLFRNLQKQIKYYEQIYKNELLVAYRWQQKQLPPNRRIPLFKFNNFAHKFPAQLQDKGQTRGKLDGPDKNVEDHVRGSPQIQIEEIVKKYYELACQDSRRNTIQNRSPKCSLKQPLRIKRQFGVKELDKKKIMIKFDQNETNDKKPSRFARKTRVPSFGDSLIISKIEDCMLKINRIKTLTETVTDDHKQIKEHFENLHPENEKVKQQIDFFQQQIDFYSNLVRSIDNKIENAYISQSDEDNPQTEAQFNVARTDCIQEESCEYQHLESVFYELFSQLNIQVDERQQSNNEERSSQKLILLSEKIDLLTKQQKQSMKTDHKKQEMVISQTLVSCLLQKMQRFGNCQSIYNKSQFKQQYLYQIGKTRKVKAKRMKTVPITSESQSTL